MVLFLPAILRLRVRFQKPPAEKTPYGMAIGVCRESLHIYIYIWQSLINIDSSFLGYFTLLYGFESETPNHFFTSQLLKCTSYVKSDLWSSSLASPFFMIICSLMITSWKPANSTVGLAIEFRGFKLPL